MNSQYPLLSQESNSPVSHIYIKLLTGESLTFEVNLEKDTIDGVLQQISKKVKYDKKNIRLIYRGKHLQKTYLTLKQQNIQKQSSIFVVFKPAQVKNEHNFQKGLTLQSYCQACQKKVYISKGRGNFNIAKIIYEAVCPECKTLTKQANSFGFFQTKYIVRAKKDDEKKGYIDQSQANDNYYHPYLREGTELDKLNYIEVTTLQLEN